MKVKDLTLPVPYHPTMDIHDPSKIQAFQDCPRGYFFSHVLGFEPDKSNVHLVFGSAWHEAMEVLMLRGYSMEAVDEAYDAFMGIYREGFPNEAEDIARAPKNPEFALRALVDYTNMWKDDKFETLYTEVAGVVAVSDDRVIHTKLDSIIRDQFGHIRSREHKTTGRNTQAWRDKWSIMVQTESYTHLLRAAFPDDEVYGIEINGAVFTKTKGAEFIRIPVQKTDKNMRRFMWSINHWLDQIDWNYNELSKSSESEDIMHCFPQNGASCSKFGCRFPGLCSTWDNPLQHTHEPPPGYIRKYWDPRRDFTERAKNVAEIDEKGYVKIKPKKQEDKEQ